MATLNARTQIWRELDKADQLCAWFLLNGQMSDVQITLRDKATIAKSLPRRQTHEVSADIAALEERRRELEGKTYTYTGPYLSAEEWMFATDEDPDYAVFWQQGRDGLEKQEIATIYLPFLQKELADAQE